MADSVSESILLKKGSLPTWASSSDIRRWEQDIKDKAVFSARTTRANYLDHLRTVLGRVASRTLKPFQARESLRSSLEGMGYSAEQGFPGDIGPNGERVPPAKRGSITDLASSGRINLILDTNVKQARSMGQMAAGENPVFLLANPAWKLTRTGARKKPRGNWTERWRKAGDACAWKGALKKEMVALKDSPIWQEIGNGTGGFQDTLGNPYPPFAFMSGMAWVNVGRREWQRMCASEGVPDGMDELKSRVAASIRKEGAKPDKPGAEAYGKALDILRAARDKAAADRGEWVPPVVFKADDSARGLAIARITAVRHYVYMAKARIEDARERARKALEAVQKGQADFPGADFAALLTAILAAQNAISAEMSSLDSSRASLNGYLRMAKEAGAPSDNASQQSFNTSMDLYAKAAESVKAKAAEAVSRSRAHADSAEREAGKVSDIVTAWKKSECDRIIGDADSVVASFADDAYEKMLEEAKKAVANHNAEMKKLRSGKK